MDPIAAMKTYKDSSYAMMLEAAARGMAAVVHASSATSTSRRRPPVARVRQLAADATTSGDWYTLARAATPNRWTSFDAC
jgi:hypothetical protein